MRSIEFLSTDVFAIAFAKFADIGKVGKGTGGGQELRRPGGLDRFCDAFGDPFAHAGFRSFCFFTDALFDVCGKIDGQVRHECSIPYTTFADDHNQPG